ncbi:MAG: L,D-transpeptidase family protein [Planctomycetota bacterium]|nr:L,D-transpeptidase family protein [Planctomycetota bacterium]
MPLDYQQILSEMNRPGRRQGMSSPRKFAFFALFLILAGGAFAAWHFGYADYAIGKGHSLYDTVRGWIDGGDPAGAPVETASVAASETASPREDAYSSGGIQLPVPAPASSGGFGTESSAVPRFTPDLARASALLGNAGDKAVSDLRPSPVAETRQPPASPAADAPATSPSAARQKSPAPSAAAAAPALSEAREQLKRIDQFLATDPAEAMRRVEELLASRRLQPDEAAEGGYRLGYAARLLKNEDKAEKSWRETAEKWPETRGGRYSALALADAGFHRYAGSHPNASRWDEIQQQYSLVLGRDDAPFLPVEVKARIKKNLNTLNDALFLGSAPTSLARYHKVESGELLGGIAKIYRVDYESLSRINGINPNRIRAGMELKAVTGEVSIVIRKNENDPSRAPTVTWFLDNRWVREYPACVGAGAKTPAGIYKLASKERDPSWTNPANGQLLSNDHPENILGSRWMAMKGMNTSGLGIHGTTVPDSVPGYASAGCVRLLNPDVEELFSFARIGATVTVLE